MRSAIMSHYEVLEVQPNAELIDIKRAYRRLALKHHPDRNNGSQQSTEAFKKIGEAYAVLSDTEKRAAYDSDLACGSQESKQQSETKYKSTNRPFVDPRCQYAYPRRRRKSGSRSPSSRRKSVDPFAQFDNLFYNDAFFNEAFKDMDDEFARRFSKKATGATKVMWLLHQCGIELNMTSTSIGNGGFSASTITSKGDAYEDRKTKTFVDNQGRTVMTRSIEKNGNRLEDTYVDKKLVARKVNGVSEPFEKILHHQASRTM